MLSARESVITSYRDHLAKRYTIENVRRFPALNDFPADKIDVLRNFFLDRVYPVPENRKELDLAFESLGRVLRSPKKLMPLLTTAVSSIWKLGALIPAAIKAGLATFEGYLEIRRLESTMVAYAESHNLTGEELAREEVFASIIAGIQQRDIERFRKDLIQLFRALANVRLLEATAGILENSSAVMRARPETYDASELAGIALGYQLLLAGLDLFKTLEPAEVDLLVHGVDEIEMDWIARMRVCAGESR